jgi:hypothetical protein
MKLFRRCALLVALASLGCGNGSSPPGSGPKPGDDAAPLAPGQEGGPPGSRGGGGGAFGGGSDPDAQATADAPPTLADDGGEPAADGALPRDATGRDRPRDLAMSADLAVTPDLSLGLEAGADVCQDGTCTGFDSQYTTALVRARSCNSLVKGQCGVTASTSLSCAGCKTWVNSSVELDAIRARWSAAGCAKCLKACPLIACRALSTGLCRSKMLAAPPDPGDKVIAPPPASQGTCVDQSDPTTF